MAQEAESLVSRTHNVCAVIVTWFWLGSGLAHFLPTLQSAMALSRGSTDPGRGINPSHLYRVGGTNRHTHYCKYFQFNLTGTSSSVMSTKARAYLVDLLSPVDNNISHKYLVSCCELSFYGKLLSCMGLLGVLRDKTGWRLLLLGTLLQCPVMDNNITVLYTHKIG